MNISKKSWHARLYCWALVDDRLPKSLCVYFWKVLLMLLFLPLLAINRIPLWLFRKCLPHDSGSISDYYRNDNARKYSVIAFGIMLWICIGIVMGMLFGLVVAIHIIGVAVFISWLISSAIIYTILHFSIRFIYKITRKKEKGVSFLSMGKEAVKGLIGRYCPTINWED